MKPVIAVEHLGKRYRIRRESANAPTNLRELLAELPRKFFGGGIRTNEEEFWALDDVSFRIMPGERVGIIGQNGAGKSTLLKLLSRITEPTRGKIILRGRVASLLEVGTGFHAELTGRENIYLNGAILGMRKAEVRQKFDAIVDFSGVEQFLDTPVKRYSSGMYVRLAFAVAAHLEPDILLVDEVLAVGDARFQKKCLGKMKEVSQGEGRTILFISHQLAMIESLCGRSLLLKHGKLALDASTTEAMLHYRGITAGGSRVDFSGRPAARGAKARLLWAAISTADGEPATEFFLDQPFSLLFAYVILEDTQGPLVPNLHFKDAFGQYLFVANMPDIQDGIPGYYEVVCIVPGNLLNAGQVCVDIALAAYPQTGMQLYCWEKDILIATIKENILTSPERYGHIGAFPGGFRPRLQWTMRCKQGDR